MRSNVCIDRVALEGMLIVGVVGSEKRRICRGWDLEKIRARTDKAHVCRY